MRWGEKERLKINQKREQNEKTDKKRRKKTQNVYCLTSIYIREMGCEIVWTSSSSGWYPLAGFCEHGNEPSYSTKSRKFSPAE
jgi:hypothetical protein